MLTKKIKNSESSRSSSSPKQKLPTRPHVPIPRAANGRMTHDIKIHPAFFPEVQNGNKTFEIRHLDRPYEVGDSLYLREWDPERGDYTGRSVTRIISYMAIMDVPEYDGIAVMAMRPSV